MGPPFHDGGADSGNVTSIKEGFGFIRPLNDRRTGGGGLFFHFSALVGRDVPVEGDEVSFSVELDRRSGREAAKAVTILPRGTLPAPARAVTVRAVVQRELRGARGGDGYGGRLAVLKGDGPPAEGDAAAGDGGQDDDEQTEVVSFDARGCERPSALHVGDLVECRLMSVAGSRQRAASRVKLIEAGGGLPRQSGRVASLKDKFGFLRTAGKAADLFFHLSEAPRDTSLDTS